MKLLPRTWPVCRIAASFLVGGVVVQSGRAQDITVTSPAWFQATVDAGDRPPEITSTERPAYGPQNPATDLQGYLYVAVMLDENGAVDHLDQASTYPYFRSLTYSWLSHLDFRPAKKAGVPSKSFTWFAVIFNPKTASETEPNATARILAVSPTLISRDLLLKRQEQRSAATTYLAGKVSVQRTPSFNGQELPLVDARVRLDAEGKLEKWILDQPEPAEVQAAVETALRLWKFAPARKDGKPIASEMRVSLVLQDPTPRTEPTPISRDQPSYPTGLWMRRVDGHVTVSFDVDPSGKTANPMIVESSDERFNNAVLSAVRTWKYRPGQENWQPATIKQRQTFTFEKGNVILGVIAQSFTVDSTYDKPKPIQVVQPVYPYELLRDKIGGQAKVRYQINVRGIVDGDETLSASRPEFGFAVIAALEASQYAPPKLHGQANVPLLKLEKKFNPAGLDGVPEPADIAMLAREKDRPESILSPKKLDTPLKPIKQSAPVFPFATKERLQRGNATVEIIVDEQGRARLPRIVNTSDPSFGYAAVQAVAAWTFEPPLAGGKPAAARVRIPFNFEQGISPRE